MQENFTGQVNFDWKWLFRIYWISGKVSQQRRQRWVNTRHAACKITLEDTWVRWRCESLSCVWLCNPVDGSTARPRCPPLAPRACWSSGPLRRRYCLTISSSSVVPFSFCFQCFPLSGFCFFFPMGQFLEWGGLNSKVHSSKYSN